ncbi:hypothetical protein QL285_040413 [Trifolium repens]|jgi:hypothetical protein|nr:hypothetical protein QL285_040413 [Trifolium repens]
MKIDKYGRGVCGGYLVDRGFCLRMQQIVEAQGVCNVEGSRFYFGILDVRLLTWLDTFNTVKEGATVQELMIALAAFDTRSS